MPFDLALTKDQQMLRSRKLNKSGVLLMILEVKSNIHARPKQYALCPGIVTHSGIVCSHATYNVPLLRKEPSKPDVTKLMHVKGVI